MLLSWLAVRYERHEAFDYGYLAFMQNYYDCPPFFHVSWSLCIEEHFYFVFPILLFWFGRSRRLVAILFSAMIVLSLVGRCYISPRAGMPEFGYKLTATHLRLEGLVLGFWAAYFASLQPGFWRKLQRASLPLAIGTSLLLLLFQFLPEVWMYRVGFSLLAFCFTAWLLWLIDRPRDLTLGWPVINAIAISSYSVYLTHALMLHVASRILKALPDLPWWSYFPIALVLVAIAGAGFYFLVERISIDCRDRWIARRGGIVIASPSKSFPSI